MVLVISGKLQHRTVSENVIHDIEQITQITRIIQIRHFKHKREKTYWSKIVWCISSPR